MNKTRRKWIVNLVQRLYDVQSEVDSIAEEEQEAYDNLPDNLNDTDRANDMYENVDDLQDISNDIEDIIDRLNEVLER